MAHGLESIAWAAPWLQPWRAAGEPLVQSVGPGPGSVAAALSLAAERVCLPVRFVQQTALPPQLAYEAFVAENSQVPTRDGLHDFFNGLCWLQLPLLKRRLNAIHAAQLNQWGVAPARGLVRDAATVFDENGAVLMGPDALWVALQRRQWGVLFGELRPLWAHARLLLLGHALLEKLVQPWPAITAHVWRGPEQILPMTALDIWLSKNVSANTLSEKPFAPLPVLGVPGWWPENQMPDFYSNAKVFRPAP